MYIATSATRARSAWGRHGPTGRQTALELRRQKSNPTVWTFRHAYVR